MTMHALAEVEQRLRRLHVTAAQVDHAGRTVIQVGDVSCPVCRGTDQRRLSSAARPSRCGLVLTALGTLADQPDAGEEAADIGRVVTIGRTVFVAQVRFLDLAHL